MNLETLQDNVIEKLTSTPVIRDLMKGQLTRSQYRRYLCDVYCYALHSSVVIALAGSRLVHSHSALASYLFRHAGEELGHDEWALSDLRDLGMSDDEIRGLQPSSPCARMIALEYFYAAHDNPVGLFGWMFVLESLGGKAGGQIAQAVDSTLGLNGRANYFLAGHAQADAYHAKELADVISRNVTAAKDQEAFRFMAVESSNLYCDILNLAYSEPAKLSAA